jgi:hypothetical protein
VEAGEPFQEGQEIWVIVEDGSQRPAVYVGQAETTAWLGGAPRAHVVFTDDRSGAEVQLDRIVPRD